MLAFLGQLVALVVGEVVEDEGGCGRCAGALLVVGREFGDPPLHMQTRFVDPSVRGLDACCAMHCPRASSSVIGVWPKHSQTGCGADGGSDRPL